ncbi:Serine/threonine-protein kinase PrkC [Enhygromyxa salina]|uniref:Serine/threonine-protein kinase PrkC n=1 Tax=Enhygromyxa salina TaxID=215803 RepID=A0A2S9YFG5_9BACT|nr:serine/threonine-protein kinase [Enhygromyxa salina]PRQ03857.1 Serine/threonine-protein kinase PrkC [Enhygromyxa salina]
MHALSSQSYSSSEVVTEIAGGTSYDGETLGSSTLTELRGSELDRAVTPGSEVGRYVILERLGAGGMGEVFAARDTELDRDIALKLIRTRTSGRDGAARRECERLRSEAQALARLSHPNVVQVFEVGDHCGRTFLAMELVHGPTLGEWTPGSLAEAVEVYAQAGRGLAAAHAAGLAHRDFKPGNALLGADGRVRVVDFGLAVAKHLVHEVASTVGDDSDDGDDSGDRGPLGSGSLAGPGTLPYMAPEQAFMGKGGAAGDQFSFCVALFEAVYGARPFPAVGVMELLYKLDTCTIEYPPSPPPVPRWLRRVLQKGLARRPEDRFESMDALVAELTRDRRRLWRRATFAAIVAGVTALTMSIASVGGEAELAAEAPEAELAGVWDDQRRAQLSLAFERVEGSWAAGSEAAVLAGLDHWSQRWLSAARDRHGLEDPLAGRAVTICLASQRTHAGVTIDALIHGDAVLLEGAVAAVDALPEPGRCAAAPRVLGPGSLALVEPERLVSELRELASAAAQRGLGHYELARAGADAVLRRAPGGGPVELAALRQRGLAELGAGRRQAGIRDLVEATTLAVRSGDRRTEAEVWVDLAWASRELDNLALRRERLGYARAHVEALLAAGDSSEADRHARMLDSRVVLATALDRLDEPTAAAHEGEAEALLLAGLDQLEAIDAGDSTLAIDYLHALARARDEAGLLDQSELDYRRALARAERVRGQDHPTNARLWYDAAASAHERGELELARERFGRARDIRRAALAVDHPKLARSELGLAELEFSVGDWAAARRHAELALHSFERADDDNPAGLAETLRLLGQLEARESRWGEAVGDYERALELMTRPGLQRSLVELELGKALAALGQHERAVELMDAALPPIAARLGAARCDQMIPSYERHAASASSLGRDAAAVASLEAALACSDNPETRARLQTRLQREG